MHSKVRYSEASSATGSWRSSSWLIRRPSPGMGRSSSALGSLARWLWVKTVMVSHFGVGAPPFENLFWWGLGCSLGVWGFDPWPCGCQKLEGYLPHSFQGSEFGQETLKTQVKQIHVFFFLCFFFFFKERWLNRMELESTPRLNRIWNRPLQKCGSDLSVLCFEESLPSLWFTRKPRGPKPWVFGVLQFFDDPCKNPSRVLLCFAYFQGPKLILPKHSTGRSGRSVLHLDEMCFWKGFCCQVP